MSERSILLEAQRRHLTAIRRMAGGSIDGRIEQAAPLPERPRGSLWQPKPAAGAGLMYATVVVAPADRLTDAPADFTCDGSNDDVTIQLAIDEVWNRSTQGGTVLLLGGNYDIRGEVDLSGLVDVVGEGYSTYLTVPAGLGAPINVFRGAGLFGTTVRDLCLDIATDQLHQGIYCTSSSDVHLERLVMWGCGGTLVRLGSCNSSWVESCYLDGDSSAAASPLVYLEGSDVCHVVNNLLYNGRYAVEYSDGASGAAGPSVNGDGGNVIANNNIQGTGRHAIYFHGDQAHSSLISGNRIKNPSRATSNTYDGIHLDDAASYNQVVANKILTRGATRMRYSIRVNNAACTSNLLAHNMLAQADQGATGTVSDAGTTTVTDNNVT